MALCTTRSLVQPFAAAVQKPHRRVSLRSHVVTSQLYQYRPTAGKQHNLEGVKAAPPAPLLRAAALSLPAVGLSLLSAPASHAAELTAAFQLAALDGPTAGLLATLLKPLFSVASLLFIVRIVMTWYPEVDGTKLPWSVAYLPTEPLLSGTRRVIPPVAGVDVSPIVWVAAISFFSETLVGPQGILNLIERQGGL